MEFCIVYFSSSVGLLSDEDLARILEVSQKNNQGLGVTGILMYLNGSILQVLEGDEQNVKNLYDRISKDPRHNRLITLLSMPIQERTFPYWLMGYKTLTTSQLKSISEMTPFVRDVDKKNPHQDHLILSAVQTFFNNNHRN
jgi:hypothetical protein